MRKKLQRDDIVYPDLSYQVIGLGFDVYDDIGYGKKESIYQKALGHALDLAGLEYTEEFYIPVKYKGKLVEKNYCDILVKNKLIIELKTGNRIVKSHIEQLYRYLVSQDLKLGILLYFGPNKLHFKRVVNIK